MSYGGTYGFLFGCPVPPGAYDHCADALRRIWKQFEGKPNIRALVLIICQTVQQVENQAYNVRYFRGINTASGQQLDNLGELINRPRQGLDDDTYRLVLLVDLRTLFSSGTPVDLLQLLRALVGDPSRGIRLQEGFPASFCVYVEDLTVAEADLFADILSDVPAAGVGGCLIVVDTDDVHTFDSIHGAQTIEGWFASIHGATSEPNGFAHAVFI